MSVNGTLERLVGALTESVPLENLILVPASRPARTIWSRHETPDRAPDDDLTLAGRELLRADNPAPTVEFGHTFGSAVQDSQGRRCAVLFAERSDGRDWDDAERGAVGLVVAALADELHELAQRPQPSRAARPDTALEARMRRAVADHEFALEYQPEVDMRTGEILAVEALVRWNHPERGLLAPDVFIELAERSDLIKLLGSWIITAAIEEFAAWRTEDVVLRINVSPAQLTGDGVIDVFATALRENGLDGSRVCVEFTETAGGRGTAELARTLSALQALGITSSIDDLATGYSTLSRLRTLPVDSIKIDRSLVRGVAADARARAIVRALVTMGYELGLQVIAEGIENDDDAAALIELGCFRGQGHHFYRAMDAAATAELLETNRNGAQ